MTDSGMLEEKPSPDQLGLGLRSSPLGFSLMAYNRYIKNNTNSVINNRAFFLLHIALPQKVNSNGTKYPIYT